MSIYTEINKAWATLFGFKVEDDEATFNDKQIFWNNNAVANWDDLLSAKPSDLKQSAGFAEKPNTKTYDELMTAENFSYSAFDWNNEHGRRIGFSLGYIENKAGLNGQAYLYASSTGIAFEANNDNITNNGLGFASGRPKDIDIGSLIIDFQNLEISADENPYNGTYFCGYVNDGETTGAFILTGNGLQWHDYNNGAKKWEIGSPSIDMDKYHHFVYFDDGAHLPEGIEWNEELRSYFVPKVKETETTTILTQTTATQAMLGAQIMTHISLWGMGTGCACFIIALVKFMGRCFSRR